MTMLLKCKGFDISGYKIPEFEIKKKKLYRINMPFTMESEEDFNLLSILLGEKKHPSIKFSKSQPLYCGKINRYREGIFKSNKVVNKLSRYFGIDKKNVVDILTSLNTETNSSWNRIPQYERCLLSFEVAIACSSFIFFDTAGLDPVGSNKMLNNAIDKSKKGYTVVHLLYPTLHEDELEGENEFIVYL